MYQTWSRAVRNALTVTVLMSASIGAALALNPAPTVGSISPASGPRAGGTSVTISGTNFLSGATVTIGGAAATNVVVVSATSITATTPASGTGGGANVTVTNPDTQSATLWAVQQPLSNPGFESGSTGWVAGSGTAVVLTGSGAHSGSNYAQITVTPPGTWAEFVALLNGTSEYLPVNPGDVISYGGWAYRVDTNAGDGLARWQIEVTNSNKANPAYLTAVPNNVTTASWIQQKNTYTIPAGVSFVRFWCQITGASALAQANCDDATLTRTVPGGGFTYIAPPTLS